jgi:hypothetical protein
MKNNSKNRKLAFIRTKNDIRNGRHKIKSFFKVSNEALENTGSMSSLIEVESTTQINKILKTWKVNAFMSDIFIASHDDDFLKNQKTVLLTYRFKFNRL